MTSAPPAYMSQYDTWHELLDATVEELHRAAKDSCHGTTEDFHQAELLLIKRPQQESFLDEFHLLTAGKPVQ